MIKAIPSGWLFECGEEVILSSLLSVFATDSFSVKAIIVPIYFTLFDGSMFLLTLRNIKVTV